MEYPLLFVGGAPRSGTTLLQMVLSAHPDIAVTAETWFIPKALVQFPHTKVLEGEELEKLKQLIRSDKKIPTWITNTKPFYERVEEYEKASLKDVIRDLVVLTGKEEGVDAKIMGNKKPAYGDFGIYLGKLFPNAKFVFIIRDPRAAVSSMMHSEIRIPYSVYNGSLVWQKATKHIQEMKEQFPENTMIIRYDEFVSEPEKMCRELCIFLGVDFDDKMITFYEGNEQLEQVPKGAEQAHIYTTQPFTTKNIDKWKEVLSDAEVRIIEYLCSREMSQLKIEHKSQPPGVMDRYRCVIKKWIDDLSWLKKKMGHESYGSVDRNGSLYWMKLHSLPAIAKHLLQTRFVQDVLTLQAGSVFTHIVGLIQSVLFARILGLEGFGVYALVLAFRGTFVILTAYGQNQATSTFFAESYSKGDREGMKSVIRYYLILSCISVAVLSLLAFFAPALSQLFYGDRTTGELARIAFLAVIAGSFHTLFLIILQTVRRVKLMTMMENANLAVQVLLALIFLALGFGVTGIFAAMLITNLLMQAALCIQYFSMKQHFDLPGIRESFVSTYSLKELVQQGLWIALHKNLVNYLLPSTLFLMSFYTEESTIGIARLAFGIGLLPAALLLRHATRMTATVLPAIQQQGIVALRRNTAKLVKHTMAFHSAISFGGLVALPILVIIFYGWEYSAVIPPMLWIILIALTRGITVANSALFRLNRESHIPALWQIGLMPLTLIVLAVLLQSMDPLHAFVWAIFVYHIGNLGPCWHLYKSTLRRGRIIEP